MKKSITLMLLILSLLAIGCGIDEDKIPSADNQSVYVDEDSSISITVTASDFENDPFTFEIVNIPSRGSFAGTLPNITYTPYPDYDGSDSFTFKVNDGYKDSNIATVDITVNPINDAPTSTSAVITTGEDTTSAGVTPSVLDVDTLDSYTYSIMTQPTYGTASIISNQLVYDPDPGYNGNDFFIFRTRDSGGEYVDGTATVTVGAANNLLIADSQSVIADEDIDEPIILTASVMERDKLSWTIVSQPSHGTLKGNPPNVTYLSALNYNGNDSFTFQVNDGSHNSNIAAVDITVNPVNDAPTSTSAGITTDENTTSAGVTPTVSDIDSGESFTFSILRQPSFGTAYVLTNQLYYEPNLNFNGSDSFTYRAFDSGNEYVDGTATVTVGAANNPPIAYSQSVIADEDIDEPIILTAIDMEGDELSWTIVSQPSHGTLKGNPPNVTYLSALNYNGNDSFTFQVNDGSYISNIAAVDITVNPVNDAPTSTSASITTDEDTTSAGVTPSVLDVDTLDSYTYSIMTQPTYGTASIISNQLVYDPDPDYNGNDFFIFRTRDSGGEYIDGTATVRVNPTPDIWFVDIDATGTADGRSWTNAFNHPQDALDIAIVSDEVWVAEGVYAQRAAPDSYVITMVDGVDLYGGFSGVETTLSGRDINARLTMLNGEDTAMVVFGADNARLDGFAITRGRLNGMLNDGVSPTIVNCIFENNGLVEGSDGGAIQNVSDANAYISSTTFINNYQSAIFNKDSSPTINNSDFFNNLSDDAGGAIKNQGQNSQPFIRNSLFDSNIATLNGGAISNDASIPRIENSVFSGNIAGENGGAISNYNVDGDFYIINSLFSENTATQSGGAIYNSESEPTLLNSTIVYNYAGLYGGGVASDDDDIEPIIINSILWNNSGLQISGEAKVTYSNIEEGFKGKGNINQDPSFVDTTVSDYRLDTGSPCIDTGNNAVVSTSLDLAGNPRIVDGNIDTSAIVDMGAYEYIP